MNSASTDLPRYLLDLRNWLQHPTDYEKAVTFFLEEFAGDVAFISQSEAQDQPALTAILKHIVGKMMSTDQTLDRPTAFNLRGHRFIHGNAFVGQRALLFFYFPEVNTGVAALIPGKEGGMEVARFQLPGGLPRPDLN